MGAKDTTGKQPAIAGDIADNEIRELVAHGYVDAGTAYEAIYDRDARSLSTCIATRDALKLTEAFEIVSLEACS